MNSTWLITSELANQRALKVLFTCVVYTNIYYSFKMYHRFWLVKTTRIIHHNQLLFTKFGKNLRHIKSMTSKVQPAADYWTVDRENLGTRLCYFWWAKWRNSFKNWEIFGMNNKAIIEFGFRRIWRILQISEGVIHLGLRPIWVTLLDLLNSSYPTKAEFNNC